MSSTIAWEVRFFWIAVQLGVRMLLVYDGLRLFRYLVPHRRFVRDLEDVVYWLCCSLWAFAVTFYENDGQVRWFFLAGLALGMLAFDFLSRKVLQKVKKWVTIKRHRLIHPGRR